MRQSLFATVLMAVGLSGALTSARQQPPSSPPAQAPAATAQGRGGQQTLDPEVIRLWDGAAPGAVGSADDDTPTLTVYRPVGRGAGTAMVVAPGGAYAGLAMNNEGRQVANWLNSMGVTAFVLKYRLGAKYHHPIPLGDALRAIRLVRARSAEWGVPPNRIGLMGFSAGGHLASTVATHFDAGNASATDPIDRQSGRPDFLVLGYPVISFQTSVSGPNVLSANGGTGRNLLGTSPSQALLDELSNEKHVTADTPPTFLYHTTADTLVSAQHSIVFYLALLQAKVPAEMHIFENGAHGSALGQNDAALSAWPTLLANWMRGRGLLTNPAPVPTRGGAATPASPAAPTTAQPPARGN